MSFEKESSLQGKEKEADQQREEDGKIAERKDWRRVSAARFFCAAGARPFSAVVQINGTGLLYLVSVWCRNRNPPGRVRLPSERGMNPPLAFKPAEF